ncbi:FAD-binding oxidoreductase [Eubacterium limosum]|uniref:D-lactate dehydrogenase (cytochrome) n=1 Tax=Eubacterium limosum TaxID=1736 RepID=A0ABT5UPD9_EUBLI|nr:FAD-binding oxidoreductase [Eubacterium limosum]MCB6569105.1 FAD-binding oxidoreductase [Eubacterium limosum]MDE1470804.1 FAD-binding oxidoreductase [Eubacterium limosum]
MKIEAMTDKYERWLGDESRIRGRADAVCFPGSFEEAREAVGHARRAGLRITPQGARTGLTGGAVPEGGLIVDCQGLKGLELREGPVLYAGAGATLEQLHAFLRKEPWVFPPNPTEESATLGGLFGCNAMGIDGQRTAPWVRKLWWLTATGEVWEIGRGSYAFDDSGCALPDGGRLSCETFDSPGVLGGLVAVPKMDLIDFLAGTEGQLGMALAFELELAKKPASAWGVLYFLPTDPAAMALCRAVAQAENSGSVRVMEYYDGAALTLLSEGRNSTAALQELPEFPQGACAAVYVELAGDDPDALEGALFEQLDIFEGLGGSEEQTWAASERYEIERFRKLRHVVPELANAKTDSLSQAVPGLTRLSSDLKGPAEKAEDYLEMYRGGIAQSGVHAVIYGAAAQNRFHVNFLPETPEERAECEALMAEWAARAAADKGQIITENGAGLLKRELALRFVPEAVKRQIKAAKEAFDPEGVFK